jgi:hypothetical protein
MEGTMRKTIWAATMVLGAVLLGQAGCADEGTPFAPVTLDGLTLDLKGTNEGVYNDQSVLTDPDNPFAVSGVAQEDVWLIQARGGTVGAFYAWATSLARGANGERQFYTARDLQAIYESQTAVTEDLELVRTNAIAGYQAVLDHFPNDVTYAADGVTTYDLATLSLVQLLAMGGKPKGGWVLITTSDGGMMAVRR